VRTLRFIAFFISILVGVAAGLAYGWLINPVQFNETTSATMRQDFRTDYVLMVSESYRADQNIEKALQNLSFFKDETPQSVMQKALLSAQNYNYPRGDLESMAVLSMAIEKVPPQPTGGAQ
jgi:hypothetical protein